MSFLKKWAAFTVKSVLKIAPGKLVVTSKDDSVFIHKGDPKKTHYYSDWKRFFLKWADNKKDQIISDDNTFFYKLNQSYETKHHWDPFTFFYKMKNPKKDVIHNTQNTFFHQTMEPSKKKRAEFVEKMISWIPCKAKTLTTRQESSESYNRHTVSLHCVGSCLELNGTVGMISERPEEAEKERQKEFHRAIEEKLPKLIKYKEKGYTTALLLEDISFSHCRPEDNWKDLIPNQYHSEFQLKIDYVVIFVSNKKKMIVGNVWKEGSQIYTEIPDNRRFSLRR